ncbi:MAG: 2,3-bisphosphoglycerate-dependent phosphoglycerate mutase [Candidatus Kapaibacteriota bacterium]|jgi:2,3-bisphosphoglycerate-dependent phosphoglycerate mutase
MPKLVLVRHGQSQWNLENKFTGWVDVELSQLGIKEAENAGKLLNNYIFDNVFTSVLKRAINTADIITKEIGYNGEFIRNEALNERHYGDLQGLNKDEVGAQYGLEQLQIWRRSYDTPPPNGESLYDTQKRVIPYYINEIEPLLKAGKNVLVVAHGNSLRSMIMHLENISKEDIVGLNIPTGTPYEYNFDADLNILSKNYLKD